MGVLSDLFHTILSYLVSFIDLCVGFFIALLDLFLGFVHSIAGIFS